MQYLILLRRQPGVYVAIGDAHNRPFKDRGLAGLQLIRIRALWGGPSARLLVVKSCNQFNQPQPINELDLTYPNGVPDRLD